ncbi:3-oxoacyl-ACP reductase FabG [Streptomyces sp. WAC05374]|uniref:3-oxoacyl-ACP reductase family protein n=1 Tax=unclassified Streptomyces TaxID=2593676 RepID=UPI000F894DCD|nr:3-oxoacyl-ACP reductase family protein [Streptomyces sp. WAC05374]RST14337.1 3-oxoacyl-ACP reductase FabG [Streptomyces sp. WAC05374]TDF41115.1 3-oxoacyl-ACP reductase FabG [Streptomyces sp. WAC05374]TDF49726.1 3-oxoacyl-ACP reductase FabG [Streptomyces sp. WAC05374]TDF51385.1 3-oxoacyl-ACP reductase FabG [Streptomyces sp. WAC05374]
MTLEGQVALVTGGSRGIGAAVCRRLAADGAAVAINYRSSEGAAKELADEIEAAGGRALAVPGDVADAAQAEEMVRRVTEDLGGLDVLVNNAGVAQDALIYNMGMDDWLDVMRVNFGGVFHCTKAVMPHFMARGSGVIVNVSSVMGERGWIGESNYAASKGAVNAFTRCCAMESARFGIRVNAVLPGFAPTDLVAGLTEGATGRSIKKQIPMRRFGEVEQIAEVVRFLSGPESSYMTGSLVNVDGGAMTALGLGRP